MRSRRVARPAVKEYDIRTPSATVLAGTLSGGNQQKIVVARELDGDLRLLVLDQPTRGLDVGSIEFIHRQAIKKRDAGTAVLLVSAELDEVLELSDRVAVMYRGQIVDIVDGRTADRNEVGMLMATGLRHEAAIASGADRRPRPPRGRAADGRRTARPDRRPPTPAAGGPRSAASRSRPRSAIEPRPGRSGRRSSCRSWPWCWRSSSARCSSTRPTCIADKGAIDFVKPHHRLLRAGRRARCSGFDPIIDTLDAGEPRSCSAGWRSPSASRRACSTSASRASSSWACSARSPSASRWPSSRSGSPHPSRSSRARSPARRSAFIVGILKAFSGAHEVVTTIMLNYIALNILAAFVSGPLRVPQAPAPVTFGVGNASLPIFLGKTGHIGILIALVAVVLIWWILYRTTLGFEIRTAGANPEAARYAGMRPRRLIILTMAIVGRPRRAWPAPASCSA